VSREFFFNHQFGKFEIPMEMWNRTGATLVGILATWWMGLLIGIPVFLLALMLPGWKAYVKHSLLAIVFVVATALSIGFGALLVAYFGFNANRYNAAGTMHDFGYLGGGIGLIVAVVYLIVVRVRWRKSATPQSSS